MSEKKETVLFEDFVTGLSHHQYRKLAKDFVFGEYLILRRIHDNAFDPEAIGVFDFARNLQVGWIPKDKKGSLLSYLPAERDDRMYARITYHRPLNPGDTHYQQCLKIKVVVEDNGHLFYLKAPAVVGFDPAVTITNGTCATAPTVKENKMTKVAQAIDTNKNAAILAAQLEAGRLANKHATKLISGKLPLMVKGYADTPLARLAFANAIKFAVDNYGGKFGKHKELASQVSEAMVVSAYSEIIANFDIDSMIEQFLEGKEMKKISSLLKQGDE